MEKQTISTDNAPAAIGPYSQGITAGDFLFVSGQLGLDPATGVFVGEDLESQAEQALRNVQAIVEAGGSDLSQVVAVDVFLTDMADFEAFNTIYSRYFSDFKPARALVEVSQLPKGGRVEVKCVAVK
jgi:2-iminobutanoate/2-iminopropanoate deaminase